MTSSPSSAHEPQNSGRNTAGESVAGQVPAPSQVGSPSVSPAAQPPQASQTTPSADTQSETKGVEQATPRDVAETAEASPSASGAATSSAAAGSISTGGGREDAATERPHQAGAAEGADTVVPEPPRGNRLQRLGHAIGRTLLWARGLIFDALRRDSHRLAPREEDRRTYAGTITDLFASIMNQVHGLDIEDMDTTMDILRYDFPNVEHIWLAERFRKAYESGYSLDATLKVAGAGRSEAERVSLSLEIFTMLHRVGGDLTNPDLFDRITTGLNLPGLAARIEELVYTPGAEAPQPMESISFADKMGSANITLSPADVGVRFRALSCSRLLIIINDSKVPLKVRERILHQGDVLPLSSGQGIELKTNLLTYKSIRFYLQMKYTGLKQVNYLQLTGESATFTRLRQRSSVARVSFGQHVEIEVLRAAPSFRLDGALLAPGTQVCTSYFVPFSLADQGPYTFSDLYESDDPARSFQLDPTNRRVLVTNLPYMNRPGVLMLTPGLAPGIVLEVSYSRNSNAGTLRVLEGDASSLTVNGAPVRGDADLKDGDLIRLSAAQHLRCRFSAGLLDEESCAIDVLRVRGLTRDFVRAGRVVDNIDFVLRRGEMACILGPSGSGKSTLLNILAGHLEPSFGTVHYNSELLTTRSTDLRRRIAFIPREDILDEAMTVGEHVYQASVIRRPALNHADRMRRVLAVLNFAGLGHLYKRRVGRAGERTISDGERTRLNLSLDLTGTAEVFLIDEPISGLASGDAERVIQTLEDMASGRILICTLHRPSLSLLKRFRKVMVLDSHGHMAFWGSPDEMIRYFQQAVRDLNLHIMPEALRAGGADFVFEVLEAPFHNLLSKRSLNSSLWQERYERYAYRQRIGRIEPESDGSHAAIPPMPRRTAIELLRLFLIWVMRTFLSRVRSRMGLYALLLEGPVLALLIAGTLRASSEEVYTFYKALHIGEYLFLSLVLAMFFGLTDAACEILRDRPILRRESNSKVFIPGYLLAKALILTGIAGVQCALYLLVGNAILGIHDMFWEHFFVMILTAFVGIALSLMVSAFVRSDRTALNIVPLLLVPQILLAGALIHFEEMNEFSPTLPSGMLPSSIERALSSLRHRVAYQDEETHDIQSKPVPLVAEFCPLRYAFEMIFVEQTSNNLWELENRRINDKRNELKTGGSEEELRFIQRAVMALNAAVSTPEEARTLLRHVRKAALQHDEAFFDTIIKRIDNHAETPQDQPVEFFFSNRKLSAMSQGVKTARKDGRINESRGYFLSSRQPRPFSEQNHETDDGTISTISRNAVYLFLMGLFPILLAGWRLRSICRGD